MTQFRDIEFSVEAIEALGAARLAALAADAAGRDGELRRALRLALLATSPPDRIVDVLEGELSALEQDQSRFDYRETEALAERIDRVRAGIKDILLPQDARRAVALLARMVALDQRTLQRGDDSDGVITDAFRLVLADYGQAWLAVPDRDVRALAATVFALFTKGNDGVRDDLVPLFRDALGPIGLQALEEMICSRLDNPASPRSPLHDDLARALIEIADARGNLDDFIALHRQAGTEEDAVKDIAERLMNAGRFAEALERLDQGDAPDWRRFELDRLRIDILDRLGRFDEAQELRRSLFASSLSPALLEDYLKRLPDADRPAARAGAIEIAERHRDIHSALTLLAQFDLAAAADLTRSRIGDVNPHLYRLLRPLALQLAPLHPLAAILIYRRLAEAVLDHGDIQFHEFAVRDFQAADALADRVQNWGGHLPQPAYRRQITARYKLERSFWERMHLAGLDWRR